MTKTEKRLVDLCELIDAYFQMQQTVVRSAIESQLKEQIKEIIEEIKIKSVRKVKEVPIGFLDKMAEITPLTREQAIAKSKEKQHA